MVFESVVTEVLNKVLGEYIENLDRKQLKIGIWGGDVVLANLKIRDNALDELDLPVQLVYGYLGKLVLKIPWKNLYSQPVIVQIEDLYALVSPKQSVQYDAEKEAKYDWQNKTNALNVLAQAAKNEAEKNKPKPDASFTEKLTAQIVNNLQVKIANVHLRYEDTTTTGSPFAFGISLHELELCTTDVNWDKCYITEQSTHVFKLATLSCLSAYMNCSAARLYSTEEKCDMGNLFRDHIANKNSKPASYNYVLGPITCNAKLKLNISPEYDDPPFKIPKVDLCLEMEKLNVGLTSTQFQNIIKLAEAMNRMQLGLPYRKYRPYNIIYKGHYKEWWKFAITAVLEENIKKPNRGWTWDNIQKHRELCRTYASKYSERELSKKPTAVLVEACTMLEKKLDLFNIILIRQRVDIEIAKKREFEAQNTAKAGWFSGWWSNGKKAENEDETNLAKKIEAAMTAEEKQKLYNAIGYEERSVPLDVPESFEAIKMYFKLIALEIGLYDDSDKHKNNINVPYNYDDLPTIILLNFSMATCNITQRPAASAISVIAGMKEIKLIGVQQKKILPTLIESKITDEFNLLDIFFETNPLDKKCDSRIKIVARPLQIIFDAETVQRLITVFAPPSSVNLSEIEGAASAKISNFKERSATGMQYIIEKHNIIDVDVLFMPNILIVPHGGIYESGTKPMIVLSLGQLHVTSCPHTQTSQQIHEMLQMGENKEQTLKSIMENSYDRFNVALDDIQLLVIRPNEPWLEVLKLAASTELHLLQPTSIIMTLALCVIDDDPRLPKTKIDIVLPSVQLNVTEDRILEALRIMTSMPVPQTEPPPQSNMFRQLSSPSIHSSISNFLNKEIIKRTSAALPRVPIAVEMIQYTNLEISFTLQELSIILYKTSEVDESCNSSPDFADYSTPVENVTVPISELTLESMPTFLNKITGIQFSQQILSVQLLQAEAHLVQRTYELVATAKLGAVNLKQYDCIKNSLESIDIIDTPSYSEEMKYLLTISYTNGDKSSPEFTTKYNSTEQLIVINFSKLNVTLHQEYLQRLLQLANGFQRKLDVILQSEQPRDRYAYAGDAKIITNLAAIVEENENDKSGFLKPIKRRNRSQKVVNSIKIRIIVDLTEVGLLITTRKRSLASMAVQQFCANIIIKTSYTQINLGLKDIIVNDLNPKTLHKNILSIVGHEALNCELILFNIDETAHYNADNMKITVTIGCMKIIFLNWFVTSVLHFLNNFQAAQEALAQASAAAADAAKQNALSAYDDAKRMRFNIHIKAPIIVIPVDSQSLDAIALDLGMLLLTNTTSELPVHDGMVIIDEIKLELKDLKLSKVVIVNDEAVGSDGFISEDSINLAIGLKSNLNIMNPINFTLKVKRNLSSSWYKELPDLDLSGRLKSIEMNLFMDDYALIMSILNRNLIEGNAEFPPVQTAPAPVLRDDGQSKNNARSTRVKSLQSSKQMTNVKIYELLKFSFQFDGVVVNLMESMEDCLAKFGIYFLSVKGSKLVDNTLSASIVLCNMQLDDMREHINSQIKQYLCRKDWTYKDYPEDAVDQCYEDRNYMVEVTAILKDNDTFAQVRVCGFDLIVCIDFLLKLTRFLVLPENREPVIAATSYKSSVAPPSPGPPAQIPSKSQTLSVTSTVNNSLPQQKKINLTLHIDEPDIILVENLDDLNTSAIIFNAQAQLNYRGINDKQIINGEINSLKMYMCSFLPERREATRHYILHPCIISLQGSTPEEEGLHISLIFSEIIINVSPATIELLNKAMLSITTAAAEKTAFVHPNDHTDIWKPKSFNNNDYWFVKVDQATDALNLLNEDMALYAYKTEKCIIEVPCISLILESGIGYYTTPMISVDTHLNAVVSNWSRNLGISGSLTLSMNYYNKSLALWEPIIELNEHVKKDNTSVYLPWELNFSLSMEKVQNEFDEYVDQNTTSIKIHSEQNLEMTLSKTCHTLINELGEAFSQAFDASGMYKPDVIAPFVVENDTGFEITLDFNRGIFTLHEIHMPKGQIPSSYSTSLVFRMKVEDNTISPSNVKSCIISPGGRAYLQTKDLSTLSPEEGDDYNVYVKVGNIYKDILLPVSRSDIRYFSLIGANTMDPWGVISEVTCEYGTTKINIHGVVNIRNYFTTPVKIYRKKPKTNEIVLVGEIVPDKTYHLPLYAIYSESRELYFSLSDYKTSVQGVKWDENLSDTNFKRQIQCDPIDTFEPLYINVVRRKTEVYYENTTKYTILSAFYTLELRPPLYLRNALPIDIKVSVAGCSVKQHDNIAKSISEPDDEIDYSKYFMKEDFLDYGEKEVNPGDVLHLPTVKLTSGNQKESKSFLLIQYLEKDWSCATEISEEYGINTTWTFSSYDSAVKMDIDLFVHYDNRFGSIFITLFSPFWFINKTGLMLTYKTDIASVEVLYHPPEYTGPILFSFREKMFFDKKKASIRVENGEWSEKIPLDVAGATGSVTCKTSGVPYHIGVHNHLTYNSLTKQITFIPFYIAANKCSFPIELQEQSRPADPWIVVEPSACKPIWPKNDLDHKIVAKVGNECTPPFNYAEVMCTLLKLNDSKYGGINVDIQTTEGGVYITFTEYQNCDAPGLLINHTNQPINYYEKHSKLEHTLEKKHSILYTWSDPAGVKKLVFGRNKQETDLRRDAIGELVQKDGSKAFWVSFLDGLQRVLLFTEDESIARKTESTAALQTITQTIDLHIHGFGLSIINNETGVDIMYLGIANSGIIWESKKYNKKRFKQMSIHDTAIMEAQYQQFLLDQAVGKLQTYTLDNRFPIDFKEMRLRKNTEREIKRSFYPGIWISMKSSPFQNQLHIKINKIQLDNQLSDPIFPVVLAPIAPPKSVAHKTTMKPFIECSVVQRVMHNSTVKQYKYASILMQEFHFKVDLLFLTAIAEMFATKMTDVQHAKQFRENVESIVTPLLDFFEMHSQQEQKNFYDNLHLGPIKIHVSFSMAGADTAALPGVLGSLVQGVGVTLTDVNDVVFRLAYFEREYQFFTQQQLISEITSHYTGQALKQLYVLVLGLDVLGNPYGLVIGLKKGVEDLFYEPFQGAIQGPGEFAEGLVLGVKSLFGHTVGGAAGAMSKITGAMGKGLAALTFDEDYQRKRRQTMNNKPKSFQEGIARSGKGLVMGFVDGVTGVVTKPVAGAREEGVEGFFKGLGKGAIGLVTRPTAGVVDFASGSLDAVKRATEAGEEIKRLRPPRFLHRDNFLRPYCLREAMGNKLLKEIEKGKYASTDSFVHCEEIVQKNEFLIISNHRVMYITHNDMFGGYTIQWTYLWHEISLIVATDRGVEIKIKKENKKMLGILGSRESQNKLILMADPTKRDKLAEILESQRNEN